jgi:uncharacterized protein YecE (DUF72 family)
MSAGRRPSRRTFRFSAKLPKTVTHQRKLAGCEDLLDLFVGEVSPLAGKLAILLVQLPPSLAFDLPAGRAASSTRLRQRTRGSLGV